MWSVEHKLFKELEESCGSKYAAVIFISELSRRLYSLTNGWVIESKLISWAITGKCTVPRIRFKVKYDADIEQVRDFLCYVQDDKISSSVEYSYRQSVKHRHLLYCYHSELDEFQRSRVRVLLRMIWYQYNMEDIT